MINNYRCFNLNIERDKNCIDQIKEILNNEGYRNANFSLKFVGFETTAGLEFKINNNTMKVPQSGKFITPYGDSDDCMTIKSLIFNSNMKLDIYCIY